MMNPDYSISNIETEPKTISDLPPEILTHIFLYLPYNVKVIRLVCSKWNETCNYEKLSGNEKIVIRGYKKRYVDEFFNSRTLLRNIYNLSLEGVTFETGYDYVSFFKKFGDKLRSLRLHSCSVDVYDRAPFLQFCKNLNSLIVEHCCSPTIVRLFRCRDGSLVQTNIVSLTIGPPYWWSDVTTDACFRICLRLRSLTLKSLNVKSSRGKTGFPSFENGGGLACNTSDTYTVDCIYHALLIRAANIIELNLEIHYGMSSEHIEQIASIPDLKLRKLRLPSFPSLTKRSICNILDRQPDLEYLSMYYSGETFNELADSIQKCSKLIHLKISTSCGERYVFDGKSLEALTCRLRPGNSEFVLQKMRSRLFRGTFDHLRALELHLPNTDYECILRKVSVNLNHLSSSYEAPVPTKSLEFISNRFIYLETLTLELHIPYDSEICEEHSLEQISFGKLKTLQIYAKATRRVRSSATTLLTRLKAPNLCFLELSRFDTIDATSLSDMVKNYPLLERFELSLTKLIMDPLCQRIISGWKRLNFFYFNGTELLQLHRCRDNRKKFLKMNFQKHITNYAH